MACAFITTALKPEINIETINLTEADDSVYVGRGYSSANAVTIDGMLGVNTIDFSSANAVELMRIKARINAFIRTPCYGLNVRKGSQFETDLGDF